MTASMTAVLGEVFPPAHRTQDGPPTPTRLRVAGSSQTSGRVRGGPAGGDLYSGIAAHAGAVAALTRINAKVRRSLLAGTRATDLRPTGD